MNNSIYIPRSDCNDHNVIHLTQTELMQILLDIINLQETTSYCILKRQYATQNNEYLKDILDVLFKKNENRPIENLNQWLKQNYINDNNTWVKRNLHDE